MLFLSKHSIQTYEDLLILKIQEKQKDLVRIQKGMRISEAAKIVMKRNFKNGQNIYLIKKSLF